MDIRWAVDKVLASDLAAAQNGTPFSSGYERAVTIAAQTVTWAISAAALAGVLFRPWRVPEWIWAVVGAVALVALRLVPLQAAASAVARGIPVYAFLVGMMALSELARAEGIFAWLAAHTLMASRGSQRRLFVLVYGVGALVTTLLSNDATAIVLTPAVFTVLARTEIDPMPFLYACAFVANAASFVMPISNPANLVVFGAHLPPLGPWLRAFGPAAMASLVATFLALFLIARIGLRRRFSVDTITATPLSRGGRLALAAVAVSGGCLVAVAALGGPVGLASLGLGVLSVVVVGTVDRAAPGAVGRTIAWPIVPLVAGLFAIVAALDRTGALELARAFLRYCSHLGPAPGSLLAGAAVALACNLFNNLPVALLAGYSLHGAAVSAGLSRATLVAVDLGPNLSITGSLATLLWLIALRRDGLDVTPWQFLRTGLLVLLPALILALLFVQ